jgi:Malectin domain
VMLHVLRSSKKFLVASLWSMRSRLPAAKLLWALIVVGLPFILCDAFASAYAASTATGHSYDVNAGGRAHKVKKGKQWSADRPYSAGGWGYIGGTTATTSTSIRNTPDARVYQSERSGDFSYKFDVPNGAYDITLRFAETYWEQPGQRKFDVFIQRKKVLDRYDICAAAGHMKAVDKSFRDVQVRDGQLTVDFISRKDNAKVSAISIVRSGSPAVPPPPSTPRPVVSPDGAPYPVSHVIASMSFDWSTHRRAALGSDNWPITWADDGEQYTSWGDGWGFSESGAKKSLGVAKVVGDSPVTYTGVDLWSGSGKAVGIISVEGNLYMWVTPGSTTQAFKESRVYRSRDHGVTWTQADWSFNFDDEFFKPTFLQFGQDYAGARDEYVYSYAPLRKTNDWVVQKPGEIILMRSHKNLIMERSAYEFFAGLDGSGAPIWTSDLVARQPAFSDPNGVMRVSVSFNPGLGRYLLITENTTRAKGNIGVFDAPEPWGPWTTVLYDSVFGAGEIEPSTFFWNFSNKWLSADGKNFTLIFTGTNSNDSFNAVSGKFVVAPGR